MKSTLISKLKLALAVVALVGIAGYVEPALTADVGVSISVGQPGFYGRIDIGDGLRPRLIYAEPYLVEYVNVIEPPVYLHVPPGHAKRWHRHCDEYNACRQRVYFVDNDWYDNVYVPHYRRRADQGHHGHDDRRHEGGRRGGDRGHDNRSDHGGHGSNSGKRNDKGKGNNQGGHGR